MPEWVEAATAAEHASHCPDAEEGATSWVMPGGSIAAPGISIEARYRKHGVCNYAALVAIADLVPQDPAGSSAD